MFRNMEKTCKAFNPEVIGLSLVQPDKKQKTIKSVCSHATLPNKHFLKYKREVIAVVFSSFSCFLF